jgi:hypothetical protein
MRVKLKIFTHNFFGVMGKRVRSPNVIILEKKKKKKQI